jgi:hypothetical protein
MSFPVPPRVVALRVRGSAGRLGRSGSTKDGLLMQSCPQRLSHRENGSPIPGGPREARFFEAWNVPYCEQKQPSDA